MRRPRPIALAGIATALLCNYWVLEGLLADRHDLEGSWISDLATRSEPSGWRFVTLGIVAGLAIAVFAGLLLARVPREGEGSATGPGAAAPSPADRFSPRRLLRGGLIALLASGLFAILASAAPLDCAEGLEASCSLAYDPLDVVHSVATAGEIAATILAFALVGIGLLLETGRARIYPRISRLSANSASSKGFATLALGAIWLLLTALTGVGYLSDGVDSVKGLFQRADQIVFGLWLALLGIWGDEPWRALNASSRRWPPRNM
ncbi:MAG: hypothetical protein ACOYD4_11190 [Solirubrobacterales bacterium]